MHRTLTNPKLFCCLSHCRIIFYNIICNFYCTLLNILSNVFAAQQKGELMERSEAIVLAPSVTVRSTPSESGTSLFILHEGRKVEIKDNSMRIVKKK